MTHIIMAIFGGILILAIIFLLGVFIYNNKLNLSFMKNNEIDVDKVTFSCSDLDF